MKCAAVLGATGVLCAILCACQRGPVAPLGLPPPPGTASTAQADLGRKLFMDRRLSANNTMSCAMCHVPEQGFAANELGTAIGVNGRSLRRNAPTLLNVAYVGSLFHDGRESTLERQAWAPMLNAAEMGNRSVQSVAAKIGAMPDYAGRFEAAFDGRGPDRATIGAALAGYQRTLVAANARFDRWRYGHDAQALDGAEQAGFAVFAGKGRCIACHTVGARAALFADGAFHNTGIGWARSQAPPRRTAVRLADGVFAELDERDLRAVSDPPQADLGRAEVTHAPADRWAYRTPSLRNIALTAPYMHDGSLATLEEVIDFYQRGGIDNPLKDRLLQPLQLSEVDKRNLAAFLRSLTGDNAVALARLARRERIDHPIPVAPSAGLAVRVDAVPK
ncbi:MAG: cytochrome c peroxidase [Pseudomonadota bacterium]|nr:cytochrome c peroxidase [Pseudomonadota bacterium]